MAPPTGSATVKGGRPDPVAHLEHRVFGATVLTVLASIVLGVRGGW
jgi:hypothetical protein